MTEYHRATLSELSAATLYSLVQLRSEVFVIEQDCVCLDPDGRDLEPSTVQFWVEEDGRVLSTLRLLDDGEVAHIGRVVTAADARGRGLAGELMRRAVAEGGRRDIVLDAQAHLEQWYAGFGFARVTEVYDLDGIPHVTMRRPAA